MKEHSHLQLGWYTLGVIQKEGSKWIVKDLLDGGYDGGFSMEPHLAVVHHDAGVQASARVRFDNYVEYGRRFMALVRELGYGDKLA